jgi:hypothetical protein
LKGKNPATDEIPSDMVAKVNEALNLGSITYSLSSKE